LESETLLLVTEFKAEQPVLSASAVVTTRNQWPKNPNAKINNNIIPIAQIAILDALREELLGCPAKLLCLTPRSALRRK